MTTTQQIIHVVPTMDTRPHNGGGGPGDCWCEPDVGAIYYDRRGRVRTRVIIHRQLLAEHFKQKRRRTVK